jgi:heme-degrading monooxygenase HmoA
MERATVRTTKTPELAIPCRLARQAHHRREKYLTVGDESRLPFVRLAVENQPGSLGTSLLTSPQRGTAILASFWASHAALQVGDRTAAPLLGGLARWAPITTEEYRVSVFEQEALLHGGEAARLTRIGVNPAAADDVVEVFGDTAVPWLAESPGFRSALLFADPASGHLISQIVWQDPQLREASPSTALVSGKSTWVSAAR